MTAPAAQVLPGDFACMPMAGEAGRGVEAGQWLLAIVHGWPRTRIRRVRPYGHAEIYVGQPDKKGPHGYTISAYPGNDEPGRSGWRPLPCPPEQLPGAVWSSGLIPLTDAQRYGIAAWAAMHDHVPYSFLGYLAIAAHGLRIPLPGLRAFIARRGHLLCSQFVDADYAANGEHLFTDGRWPGYVDPLMLADLLLTLQAGGHTPAGLKLGSTTAMSSQSVNVIRLGVAAAVGYLIAFAAAHGFPSVDPAAKAVIITAIVGVVTPAYTALVHKLEARYPVLGHLLLVRKAAPPAKPPAGIRALPTPTPVWPGVRAAPLMHTAGPLSACPPGGHARGTGARHGHEIFRTQQ